MKRDTRYSKKLEWRKQIIYYEGDEIRFRGQYAIILEVYEDTEEYLIEMEDTGDQFTISEKDIE